MKKVFVSAAMITIAVTSFAQKDAAKYKERSEELRQELWGSPVAEFKAVTVPKEMDDESAVVIANSFEIINSSKRKLKFTGFGVGAANRIFYRTVVHQRIKINDKTALEKFSTIEYQKKLDNSTKFGLSSIYDKMDTYIGSKIIKPGGKEIIVNTDEEVLTKNESKSQKSKLAISDLQVGDILDYYIVVEEMQETGSEVQGPYTFVMNGEYPVLYYNIRFQLDEKAGVKYIAANNAPSFKESKTEDGDIVLELKLKNLPKYLGSTWTSPYRQYPYIAMKYKLTGYSTSISDFSAGRVESGTITDKLVKQYKNILTAAPTTMIYIETTSAGFKSIGGKKNAKKIPEDSLLKALYNGWRYERFCEFDVDKIDVSNDINYQQANSLKESITMSRVLKSLNMPHDVVLLCSRNGNSLNNSLDITDMDAMIRVPVGNKHYWMAFDNITTNFNEIPARFQGEEAITLHGEWDRKWFLYTDGKLKVPVTTAGENIVAESISVSMVSSNMQQLKIDRTCTLTGSYHGGEQKRLSLMENMESELAKWLNQKTFTERLNDNKRTQNVAVEFVAAFKKEKADWKNYFKDEIKEQYEEEPKEVIAYSIKADGMHKPQFSYQSSFTMDNFVKKAGNNYILDVGKLIGKYSKIEEKERSRKIDVYMHSARTFNYSINIDIPEGFTVKGVEDLGKSLTNPTGSFTSTAAVDGKVLKVTVTRTFTNNFEKAADWPKLVELLDAVYDFYGKKVLLEKKK